MNREQGLRQRKKAQQREHIADLAAQMFAQRGYDAVSIVDVARAAGISDQTIYNYFPTKPELVLDRADEFRQLYEHAIIERPAGTSPASALRSLVDDDIDRYRQEDLQLARGEFPALCLESGSLRRFALELREQQAETMCAAILRTAPEIPAIVARAHAAALVSVIQSITDEIGARIIAADVSDAAAANMKRSASLAFDDLDQTFNTITSRAKTGTNS